MKKEIKTLLNCESARWKILIGQEIYLKRWTKDGAGHKVDGLCLEFCGNCIWNTKEIISRDFTGIKNEVTEAMEDYYEFVKKVTMNDWKNGHTDKKIYVNNELKYIDSIKNN